MIGSAGQRGLATARACAALGLWGLVVPASSWGQNLTDLAFDCGAGGAAHRARCMDAALALQAIRSGFGFAAAGGNDLPGSSSTMGHRLPGSPRLALSARASAARFSMPDLLGAGTSPAKGKDVYLPVVGVSGTVGLLDGLSLAPSFGGIFSLDLFGNYHWLLPSEDDGFRKQVGAWGLGARLGLLRESFVAPGISLSLAYRSLEKVDWGRLTDGDPVQVSLSPDVTSLRALVGKDLLGIGLVAGLGLDRYSAAGVAFVPDPASESVGDLPADGLRSDRRLFFLGGSMTFLVLQLSGEVGWAEGFRESYPPGETGRFDPRSKGYYASAGLRATF